MREAFSKELQDGSASARRALARTLLDEAAKMSDAPADEFVLLGGAIQSAVEAADLPLALEAADRMAGVFELDGLAVKASAALKLTPKAYAANPENLRAGLELLGPLKSAENFAAAAGLVTILEQVPVADPLLRAFLPRRATEIEELRAARERLTPVLLTLKAAPDDPAANLAVGRYTAMLRGDWKHGLPLLAKGDDPKLAALASAALAEPTDATVRAQSADGWWQLAQASTGLAKTTLAARAADDYRRALPGLNGLQRVLAERRIAEADAVVALSGPPAATSTQAGPAATNGNRPAPAAPEDVFKDKGLTKVGFLLETADETEVHAAANSVRGLKIKLSSEASARVSLSRTVDTATDALVKLANDLSSLDDQMQKVKNNPARYNQLVDPFNAMFKEVKQRRAALDELRKKQAKLEDSQPLYSDSALAAAKKADSATATYAQLAQDSSLKAAIDAYNKVATQTVKLGPSGALSTDIAFLKKCVSDLADQGIPIRMMHGVPVVEVIINGKKHDMIWDSGASDVSLSAETAAELGLHATDKDPTIVSIVADGRKVESKLIVAPEVRVGMFTAANVECTIDPPSGVRGPDLLGGSFQHHFLCRLDQEAGLLHLTPIDRQAALSTTGARPAPSDRQGSRLPPPAYAPPAPGTTAASPPVASGATPAPAGLQPGLLAELYQDTDFSRLIAKRIDRQIYFEWQNSGPDRDITGGRFSIRWTGALRVPKSGSYTFFASVDDEVEIRVDGETILARHDPSRSARGEAKLSDGLHRIRIDYRNTGSEGRLMLQWAQENGFPRQGLGPDVLWHERAAASDAEPAMPGWRSELICGRAGGDAFREEAPDHMVLVGFELTQGTRDGHDAIKSARAIYRGTAGEVMGKQRGDRNGEVTRLLAKPGYAVGIVQARSGDHIDGFSLHFMRLGGDTLIPTDSYDSAYYGGAGGDPIDVGQGRPVVGVYGVSGGNLDGLGLVMVEAAAPAVPAAISSHFPAAPAHVTIISADYGSGDRTVSIVRAVQAALDSDPFTPIDAGSGWAGDPAPGVGKTLTLSYRIGETTFNAAVPENHICLIPRVPEAGVAIAGASVPFRIVAARYGADNAWVDATEAIRAEAQGPAKPFKVRNMAGGKDLRFGKEKHLVVYYEFQGRRFVHITREGSEMTPALIE